MSSATTTNDTTFGKQQSGVHPSAIGPDPTKPSESSPLTQTQTQSRTQSDVHFNSNDSDPNRTPANTTSSHSQVQPQPGTGSANTDADGLEEGDKPQDQLDAEGYPEQRHAGKVGLGPEYGHKKGDEQTGIASKITGFKEEVKGKITRNPDLAQKGHERRTGELAEKAQNKSEQNPFGQGSDAKSEAKEDDTIDNTDAKEDLNANAHPNEKPIDDVASKEQASTTSPEGTRAAGQQASEGRDLGRDKITSDNV